MPHDVCVVCVWRVYDFRYLCTVCECVFVQCPKIVYVCFVLVFVRFPPLCAYFLYGVCTISASCVWFAYVLNTISQHLCIVAFFLQVLYDFPRCLRVCLYGACTISVICVWFVNVCCTISLICVCFCTTVVRLPPMFALFVYGVCTISFIFAWFVYFLHYFLNVYMVCVRFVYDFELIPQLVYGVCTICVRFPPMFV